MRPPLSVDRIRIRELRVRCIVGVLPHERRRRQDVLISLDVGCDLRRAAHTGTLADTIDYGALAAAARALVTAGQYRLLESMAEDLATLVLQQPGAHEVQVTVAKPAAVPGAAAAEVELVRGR